MARRGIRATGWRPCGGSSLASLRAGTFQAPRCGQRGAEVRLDLRRNRRARGSWSGMSRPRGGPGLGTQPRAALLWHGPNGEASLHASMRQSSSPAQPCAVAVPDRSRAGKRAGVRSQAGEPGRGSSQRPCRGPAGTEAPSGHRAGWPLTADLERLYRPRHVRGIPTPAPPRGAPPGQRPLTLSGVGFLPGAAREIGPNTGVARNPLGTCTALPAVTHERRNSRCAVGGVDRRHTPTPGRSPPCPPRPSRPLLRRPPRA